MECLRIIETATYLGIDRECRIPTGWWYNFTNAVLASFRTDLAHVFHRVAKLFLSRAERGRVGETEQAVRFWLVAGVTSLSSPRNSGHVQRFSSSRTERDGMVVP